MFQTGDLIFDIYDKYNCNRVIYLVVGKFDVGHNRGYKVKPINKDKVENKVMNDDGTISYTYNYVHQFFVKA